MRVITDLRNFVDVDILKFPTTRRRCDTHYLTLLVTVSIEDSDSGDTGYLRTPWGARAKGLKAVGEREAECEFRVYKGITFLCSDSPVSTIIWLLVGFSEDISPSVKQKRQLDFLNSCQIKWLKQ